MRYIYTRLNPLTRHIFSEADDPLLNYLNEEGQSIEPEWCVGMSKPQTPSVLLALIEKLKRALCAIMSETRMHAISSPEAQRPGSHAKGLEFQGVHPALAQSRPATFKTVEPFKLHSCGSRI